MLPTMSVATFTAPTTSNDRVTITDVAREAGVSVATVSKVVNGRYGVAPATTEKVMAVVDRLGYESSLVASSLRRGATNVLGVLLAGFDPYAAELLKGISAHALGRGYDLLAFSGAIADDSTQEWEKRTMSRLGGTLIDGAIILTPTINLPNTKMPVVAIDPHTGHAGTPSVAADGKAGAQEAVKYLADLGHTRIAHIRGRMDLDSAHQREDGYKAALEEAGIPFDHTLVADGGFRRTWALGAALDLLRRPNRPTAIFAANDVSALGVYDAAKQLGLRIPEDLSVVGFDDIPEAKAAEPSLTTVTQPLHEMGGRALDVLLDMLKGKEVPMHSHLATRLVIRESTGPVPTVE